jgi:parvulin-like peptidyl-prolyl isomerase
MSGFRNMILKRFILMLALVPLGGCGEEPEEIQPTQPESPTIAVMNGRPLLRDQSQSFLSLAPDDSEEELTDSRREAQFREFLLEQLLLQEATRQEITVDEEEVQRKLVQWLSQEQEVTEQLRERVRTLLTIQRFIKQEIVSQIEIGNQEIYRYYTTHAAEYIIEDEAHVLEVMVKDREQAEEIREQLNFGDTRTFKSMAQGYSQGLTAQAGGDLGTFIRGQLPENFEKTIFQLKPGEISPVFRSPEGYHIFMMEEWVPRHAQKFYEVQETIFEKLVAAKERVALDEYVNRLFEGASIEIHDETLTFE